MIAKDINDLHEHGWFLTETFEDEDMLQLARSLGIPLPSRPASPLIDPLRPVSRSQAHPFSLSAQHGAGAFPLHTDTAHWRTPARYVLLRAVGVHNDSRATLLLDSRSLPLEAADHCLLKRAVFAVRNGRSSFFSTILPEDERFLRFDRGCMSPRTPSARHALCIIAAAEASCSPVEINWAANRTLVLDNWRLLHGRCDGGRPNKDDRLLQRVLVAQKN